jgi:hypothetical protein
VPHSNKRRSQGCGRRLGFPRAPGLSAERSSLLDRSGNLRGGRFSVKSGGRVGRAQRAVFPKRGLRILALWSHGRNAFFDPAGQIAKSRLCPDFPEQLMLD